MAHQINTIYFYTKEEVDKFCSYASRITNFSEIYILGKREVKLSDGNMGWEVKYEKYT